MILRQDSHRLTCKQELLSLSRFPSFFWVELRLPVRHNASSGPSASTMTHGLQVRVGELTPASCRKMGLSTRYREARSARRSLEGRTMITTSPAFIRM